jgi:hypothetical protein
MLKPVNAVDCTSGAFQSGAVLKRSAMRDESNPITTQATAITPYFNALVTGYLPVKNRH